MSTVRQRAAGRLASVLAQHRHPSHQLLDRFESSLRTREDIEAYAWMLDHWMEGQRYPSLRMLDRLEQAALAHELLTRHETDTTTEDEA